jgi:hypothetical protein
MLNNLAVMLVIAGKQDWCNLPRFCAWAGCAASHFSGSTVAQLLSLRAALKATPHRAGEARPREACSRPLEKSEDSSILTRLCCT